MYYKYEDDGSDPGLDVQFYDSDEYEFDEFGERIGMEDEALDEGLSEATTGDVTTSPIEDGFGETIHRDDPHLAGQIDGENLPQTAESDHPSDETPEQAT